MMEKKRMIVLSREGRLQQQRFFRLCSESDHRKLVRKEEMSMEDFERITFLLRCLDLKEYELFVQITFDKLLMDYAEKQKWLDSKDYSDGAWLANEYAEVTDQWIYDFCNQIPRQRTRDQYMKKYVWDKSVEAEYLQ